MFENEILLAKILNNFGITTDIIMHFVIYR